MAGLHFEITGDNSSLINSLNQVQQGMRATQQTIMNSGSGIENILSAIGDRAGIMADLMKKAWDDYGMSTATTEQKIQAFNRMLADTQAFSERSAAKIRQLGDELKSAMDSGNLDVVNSLFNEISKADEEFRKATQEVANLKSALSSLNDISISNVSAPMLFSDAGEFNQFKQMQEQIQELQEQKVQIQIDGGNIDAIQVEIDDLNQKLREAQTEAEQAAAKYGAELGSSAAEASARLWELNTAVNDQETALSRLTAQLEEARSAFEALKNSDNYEEVANARANYEALSQAVAEANTQLSSLKAQQADAGSQWAQISGQLEQHDSLMVKMLGGYDKYQQVLGHLPGPLQNVIGGITGMTGAAKAFIATPLGAVIAAITLAIQALTSWFNSSSEGQMAFAKVSGYVSGVLDQLKEIVIWVGEALFKAFTDPKKAVEELWEAIKSNIMTRIKSMGNMFVDLGRIIEHAFSPSQWGKLGDDFAELGKHFVDGMTGVENSAERISKHIADTHETAKKNAELAERERKLAQEKSKWKVKEAELDAQIADARLKAQKGDQAATKEAEKLIKEKYATEKKFAQENLAIIKERNSLTTNSDEDYDAEHEAEAALKRLDAQEKQELRYFDRRQSMLGRQNTTLENKQTEAQRKLAQTMEQLEESNNARRLQTMADGHKKRMDALDHEYNEELLKIKKQAAELAKLNNKAGESNVNENGLTSEQQQAINEATELANQAHQKQVQEEMKVEAQYMLDYLKEYGSFQQQKLAIAQEYAEKIRKAEEGGANEWRIKTLEKERDNAVQQVDNKALAQDIDWQLVLTGFTSGFEGQMRDTLSKLKEYINTPEFTGQTAENKQIIYDAMQRIEDALPEGKGTLNIGELNRQLELLSIKLQNTQEAAQRYNEAIERVEAAQKAYEDAVKKGDKELISVTQSVLDGALAEAESTKEIYETLKEDAENYSRDVKKAYEDTIGSIEGFAQGLSQLNSGSLRGAYDGLKQSVASLRKLDLGKSVNEAVAKFGEALDALPLLGAVLDLLDVLKEGIGQLIGGLIETIFDAVNGLLSDVLTGKFLVDIGTSLYKGVMGLFDTLTFGGLSSLFGGESDKTLERDIEQLTASNEALRQSIDAMNEDLEKASTVASYDIVKSQQKNLEAAMENTAEMMRRSASAWSNGFFGIGGKKSSNTKINNVMTAAEWQRISEAAGKSVRNAEDFFNLTSEQMWKVMKEAPDLYGKIKSYADNGYKDAAQFMDDYISYWQEIHDMWDAWREKVTDTTANDIQSEFKSALLNMESDAETFGNNFSEIMRNAIVNSMMDSRFNARLEKWYDNFAEAMGDDGNLSESEIERLRQEYDNIANEALAWREQLFSTLGLDESSSSTGRTASSGGIAQASQDSIDELNGRMTAIQGHTYLLSENSKILVTNTTQILNFIMGIEAFQKGIHGFVESIDRRLKNVDANIGTMITKGVKMI